jgi:hypothetical protein
MKTFKDIWPDDWWIPDLSSPISSISTMQEVVNLWWWNVSS